MSILDRFQSIKQGVVEHAKRIARFEEGPGDFIIAMTGKCHHFLRHRLKPVSREHKHAIHYVKRGIKAYNAKHYDLAEEHFQLAIGFDGNYARAYLYLGNTYNRTNQVLDAVKMWNKAIDLEPKSNVGKKAAVKLSRYGPRIHEV